MPDDAARWRSNLHFARLIRNNRSPLTQSQSWSPGQERNHSWRSWLVGPPSDGHSGSNGIPSGLPTNRSESSDLLRIGDQKRWERIHGPNSLGLLGPAMRDDIVHAQVFHELARAILGGLAAQELT